MEESLVDGRRGVLKSTESSFKAMQKILASSRSGIDTSADVAWLNWLKCQGLHEVPDGEVVDPGKQQGETASLGEGGGEAALRKLTKEDLVFARTKRRTFFPGIKMACPGQSDRVKVKCSTAGPFLIQFSGDFLQDR